MGAKNIRPKGGTVKHPSALAKVSTSIKAMAAKAKKGK